MCHTYLLLHPQSKKLASDRVAIAKIMAIVARLMTELVMVNAKLVVALQTNCASRGGREGRDRNTSGQGAGSRAGAGTGTGA